jgi:hypothetical protein
MIFIKVKLLDLPFFIILKEEKSIGFNIWI